MLSLSLYKIFHLVGIFLLLTTLGAMASAGRRGSAQGLSRAAAAAHGIALLLILVSGFGMLARLGLPGGMPLWVWLKLGVWVLLGAMPVVIRRVGANTGWLLYVAPVLGAAAAYLAIYKPGP